MKIDYRICGRLLALLGGVALLLPGVTCAFPPAPHHVIYGTVRDELGDPIYLPAAEIILETLSGETISGRLGEDAEPGVNYRLFVPMDAGLTDDNYKATALRPTVPFVIKVVIGSTTFLPIEMSGNFANLGEPAGKTRIDLTLGEDSDGDGLPDAWERLLASQMGGGLGIADIHPGDDADADGLSNLDEYLAGTYAFDPEDGFALELKQLTGGVATVEFLAIRGHTYSILGTSDLMEWTPVEFSVPSEGAASPLRQNYLANDFRRLQVEIPNVEGSPGGLFFKAVVR